MSDESAVARIAHFAELVACAMEARRVEKHVLDSARGEDPRDAVPGGLRVMAGDGDPFAEQRVQERALSDVRPADQRHRPGADHGDGAR